MQIIKKMEEEYTGNTQMRNLLEGKLDGKRGVGRPRDGSLNNVKSGSYQKIKDDAQDRQEWRRTS